MDMSPQPTHYQLIAEAARIRGLKCVRIARNYWIVKDLKADTFFRGQIPQMTSAAGWYACSRRTVTRGFLKVAKVPVPKGKAFSTEDIDRAWSWGQALNRPLVVKPSTRMRGEAVVTNIRDWADFNGAWANAGKLGQTILVEEMVPGRPYRLLVVGGCLVAFAALDSPAGEGAKAISKRHLSSEVEHEPFTGCPHADFRAVAERVASILPPVDLIAIDIIAEDIAAERASQNWFVVNTVADPNLTIQKYSFTIGAQDVAGIIIDYNRAFHIERRKTNDLCFLISTYAPGWKGHNDCFKGGYALNLQLLRHSCWARNLAVEKIESELWSISDGKITQFMSLSMPESTSWVARSITNNKEATKRLLRISGINTPKGKRFAKNEVEAAIKFFRRLQGAVVVKPLYGSGGKGVTVGIEDEAALREALGNLKATKCVVEEYICGRDYRILVVRGRFVAAMLRVPANVVGDGEKRLAQLISKKNEKRKPDPFLGNALIKIDPIIGRQLELRGITSETVLPKGEILQLQGVANIHFGGDSIDVTEFVHRGFQDIVERTYQALPPLAYCGFDLIADDITLPPEKQTWAIIEVNVNAEVALHHFPCEGQARDAAGVLIDSLFPHAKARAMETLAKTVKVVASGKVQNVGFRNWVRKQALRRALDGWVRNVSQDRVEAVFSGMPVAVEDMVRLCQKGPSGASVEEVQTSVFDQKVAADFIIEPEGLI